jgi:hypothetical protein
VLRGNEKAQPTRHLPGQQNTCQATQPREQETLQQELADHAPARCAQCQADAEFLLPCCGANQHQVCHIRAYDEQQNGASPEQGLEHRSDEALNPLGSLVNRQQRSADVCVTPRIALRQTPRNRLDFRAGLRQRNVRPQASQQAQPSAVASILEPVFSVIQQRIHRERHPEVERKAHDGSQELRRGDTDHRQFLAVHANRLTDNLWVRMKMPPPESGANDRDRMLSRSLFLLFSPEESAGNRPDSQYIEKIPGYEFGPDALRLVLVFETQRPKLVCERASKGT